MNGKLFQETNKKKETLQDFKSGFLLYLSVVVSKLAFNAS